MCSCDKWYFGIRNSWGSYQKLLWLIRKESAPCLSLELSCYCEVLEMDVCIYVIPTPAQLFRISSQLSLDCSVILELTKGQLSSASRVLSSWKLWAIKIEMTLHGGRVPTCHWIIIPSCQIPTWRDQVALLVLSSCSVGLRPEHWCLGKTMCLWHILGWNFLELPGNSTVSVQYLS